MPRVIAGQYKGRVIQAPPGDKTRPTTDKVKEALFSIIQTRVPGARVLDIFSGSGQIAIEALSRGADRAVLVERNGRACAVIRDNLGKIGIAEEEAYLMRMNALDALTLLGKKGEVFDIIYMDPPYKEAKAQAAALASVIARDDLLSEDGLLIVEHSKEDDVAGAAEDLEFFRSCSYGLTVITFFKRVNK